MKKEPPITVAGVTFTKERFPFLYDFARHNPEGLEAQLRSIARASGASEDNLHMVAICFELDLQHDRAV